MTFESRLEGSKKTCGSWLSTDTKKCFNSACGAYRRLGWNVPAKAKALGDGVAGRTARRPICLSTSEQRG